MLSAKELKMLGSLKQKKYREQEGKFLIEGFHLVEECLSSSFYLKKIIVSNDTDENKLENIKKKFKNIIPEITEISPRQFKKISETENPQGIIGVVGIPSKLPNTEEKSGNLIIALDRINDPGNLGTIIRTAYWFGADRILAGKNSADIYNSKVIRSSQGGIFHIEIQPDCTLEEELKKYRKSGFNVYLFTLDAEKYLDEIKNVDKSVLVFGNETEGISSGLFNHDYQKVKIRGFSSCESLNAAISSAIGLYHFRNK
ncbi:MAG: RNA methyltransferase [Ignavibacteriae bacterium]|nr:MAG: RNA methyltransferase [Ignavibacteriota bacterium]